MREHDLPSAIGGFLTGYLHKEYEQVRLNPEYRIESVARFSEQRHDLILGCGPFLD